MKKQGFTLFTALVSFVLIILALLLVQNMLNTERNTSDTIKAIEEQSEMQAIADLARADALQVFNYGVRWQIEEYLADPENTGYLMTREKLEGVPDPWQTILNDFATTFFGGRGELGEQQAFATRLASQLTILLQTERYYKGYKVEMVVGEQELKEALVEIVNDSIEQGFFEVIGCPDGEIARCRNGSFYVNLNLSELSDESYEKLPQIKVTSYATGRVIKEPVLPRGYLKIYVPIRLFKAMSIAKELALSGNGFFSMHSELDGAMLGMCDAGSCYPRENPFAAQAKRSIDGKVCPGDPRDMADSSQMKIVQLAGCAECSGNYDSTQKPSTQDAVRKAVEERVCAQLSPNALGIQGLLSGDKYELVSGECDAVKSIEANAFGKNSKDIIAGSEKGTAFCAKLDLARVVLEFKELDDNYKVNAESELTYRITLGDGFEPFQKGTGIAWECRSTCEGYTLGGACEKASCTPP